MAYVEGSNSRDTRADEWSLSNPSTSPSISGVTSRQGFTPLVTFPFCGSLALTFLALFSRNRASPLALSFALLAFYVVFSTTAGFAAILPPLPSAGGCRSSAICCSRLEVQGLGLALNLLFPLAWSVNFATPAQKLESFLASCRGGRVALDPLPKRKPSV